MSDFLKSNFIGTKLTSSTFQGFSIVESTVNIERDFFITSDEEYFKDSNDKHFWVREE